MKRYKKKHYDITKVKVAVECIISKDTYKLKTVYKDHSLKGNWQGYRELHIEDDWLLIYKIEKESITLVLTRTGKHDDLFD
ncbi:hypothetical protein RT42_GL000983 [Enterococcus cecorum DSM 20682 = ATCC 43198]|nr:hypothetical protein RT42_GL000983 [Enterococcus cecorum DSM 20682 = ATCC 43198]